MAPASSVDIEAILGSDASLLTYQSKTIPASRLHLPGPDFVERIFTPTDRSPRVLGGLQGLFDHGRLGGTGYVSILPVDQGIEHSAGASFAPNPIYFDGENIVKLAIEGGCNAVCSTYGVLSGVSRRYAHKIPRSCSAQPARIHWKAHSWIWSGKNRLWRRPLRRANGDGSS